MCTQCSDNSCESCNPILLTRGPQGPQGNQGFNGWSPLLGLVQNDGTNEGTGNLYSLKFISWNTGTGTIPPNPTAPNIYMQANGIYGALSTAVNLKGPQGNTGANGIYITWVGDLSTAPVSPVLLEAYHDTTQHKSFIWTGASWQVIAIDGLGGGAGTPGVSVTFLGDVTSLPGSPTLNQVARLTTVTPITAYLYNGTSWVVAWKDGLNGSNGTNGTNGANGFNYETLDGNGIPAEATNRYQLLVRNSADTGYTFISIAQLKKILNQS